MLTDCEVSQLNHSMKSLILGFPQKLPFDLKLLELRKWKINGKWWKIIPVDPTKAWNSIKASRRRKLIGKLSYIRSLLAIKSALIKFVLNYSCDSQPNNGVCMLFLFHPRRKEIEQKKMSYGSWERGKYFVACLLKHSSPFIPSSTFARLQDENNKSINFSWNREKKTSHGTWWVKVRFLLFNDTLLYQNTKNKLNSLLTASSRCFSTTMWKGWVWDILRSNLQRRKKNASLCEEKKKNSHLQDIDLRRDGTKGNKIITKLCINFLQTHRFDMSAWTMPFISRSLSIPSSFDLIFSYVMG